MRWPTAVGARSSNKNTMYRRELFSILISAAIAVTTVSAGPAPKTRPKLVLAIILDQFRYDYLTRFDREYKGGFRTLLDSGAVFIDAHQAQYPTVTAPGHAAVWTGSTPSLSGIIGNEWFDRASGKTVTSVLDETTHTLGGNGPGSSPRRLLVSTLGDEIKLSGVGESKVISMSMKNRGAVLTAGRMGDAAYWFDGGNFVSSTYYFAELPSWVQAFNRDGSVNEFLGAKWNATEAGASPHILPAAPGGAYLSSLVNSPFGTELLARFAAKAIRAETLGRHTGVDLLSVSFSTTDFVGHHLGPYSPEMHDLCVQTDRVLGDLLRVVDREVGLKDVVVVLTADHGVAPVPEEMGKLRMPGGRYTPALVSSSVQARLVERFGEGRWIRADLGGSLYLDYDLIRAKSLGLQDVIEVAAAAVPRSPEILRVYTRMELERNGAMGDRIGELLEHGFHRDRSADVFVVMEPYWQSGTSGTGHGSPFRYDTHVPVILMGPDIRPGVYTQPIAVYDIAPTVAALIGIDAPSGCVGTVLPIVSTRN